MDWIHPWIGLDWIGLGRNCKERVWIGLDWVRSPKNHCEQLNCFIVLLSRSRLELLLTYLSLYKAVANILPPRYGH